MLTSSSASVLLARDTEDVDFADEMVVDEVEEVMQENPFTPPSPYASSTHVGPHPTVFTAQGQDSLTTGLHLPSQSIPDCRTSTLIHTAQRGGFGYGGRGGRGRGGRTDMGDKGGGFIQVLLAGVSRTVSAGCEGERVVLARQGNESDKTSTNTRETLVRAECSNEGSLGKGASVVGGPRVPSRGLACDGNLSYRDLEPDNEEAGSEEAGSKGRTSRYQGSDSGIEALACLDVGVTLHGQQQPERLNQLGEGSSSHTIDTGGQREPERKGACVDTEADESGGSSDEGIPVLSPFPDYASQWTKGPYKDCRGALVARAYIQAQTIGWNEWSEHEFRSIGSMLLCSIPDSILIDVIQGDLGTYQDSAANKALFSTGSAWIRRSFDDAPNVYAVLLVDTAGRSSLSSDACAQVIPVLRRYTELPTTDDAINEAVSIDNAFKQTGIKTERKHIRNGRHRFLWSARKGNKEGKRHARRIAIVRWFCDALEERVQKDKVLPLYYYGYAFNFQKQIIAHDEVEASSFLIQLVGSICQVLWPEKYSTVRFPIFFANSAEEAKIGDALLTLLGHGLAETGTGYVVHQPGINCASADMKERRGDEIFTMWRQCKEFRLELGYYSNARDRDLVILGRIRSNQAEIAAREQARTKEEKEKLVALKA